MDGLHVGFIGRTGADAELRWTQNRTALVNVSVLVQDNKAADGQGQWVRVGHFGQDAEDLVQQLVKGADVYVEGRLKLNTWQASDGTQRSGLNVTAWKLEPIGQIGRRGVPRAHKRRGTYLPSAATRETAAEIAA
jgi:single-strand DNA-binding protein